MAGRFIPNKLAKGFFCPAIASKTAPSRAELNAGVLFMAPNRDNDEAVARDGLSGWTFSNNAVDTSDGDSDFDKTAPGTNSAEASSITFFSSKGVRTVRNALAKGTAGFVVWMWDGDTEGFPCEVWPVRISANSTVPNLNNQAMRYRVDFAVTSEPALDAVVPAA